MDSSIWFFAGLLVGVILGMLITILLFWVAKHYPELDDPYDENDLIQ